MAQATKVLPGMRAVYTQPIEMRINEMVAGIRADLGIKLYGDDLETLEGEGRGDREGRQGHPRCGRHDDRAGDGAAGAPSRRR